MSENYWIDFVLFSTMFNTFHIIMFMLSFYNQRGSYIMFLIMATSTLAVSKYSVNLVTGNTGLIFSPLGIMYILFATLFTFYYNSYTSQ